MVELSSSTQSACGYLECNLTAIARQYIWEHSNLPSWRGGSRLVAINPDYFVYNGYAYVLFEGHRFCEPYQDLDEAWFFSTFERPPPVRWTEWVKQTFHPKINGMEQIKRALSLELLRTQSPIANNGSNVLSDHIDVEAFLGGTVSSIEQE